MLLLSFSKFPVYRLVFSIFLIVLSMNVRAEIYLGIEPDYTLGDVQKRFPNAQIKVVNAAWVQENEAFYSVSGAGFSGLLYIAFHDPRVFQREMAAMAKEKGNIELADSFSKSAQRENRESLEVKWMRWVPDSPIPIQRYLLKYGKPKKLEFREADMAPYYAWKEKGVTLNVSDDEKTVLSVEFNFTREEKIKSCMKTVSRKLCESIHQ